MFAKVLAFIFAIIQVLLLLRLALPFLHWPAALDEWIPKLINATDVLAAPFHPIVRTLDIKSAAGGVLSTYTNQLDAGVLVAMVGWGLIAIVILMVLSLLSRAR
jgi:hypothetical protein